MPPIVNVLKLVLQDKPTGWVVYNTYLGACSPGRNPNPSAATALATTVWAMGVCVELNHMGEPHTSAIFSASMEATFSLSVTLYSDLYCAIKTETQLLVDEDPDTCFSSPLLLSPQRLVDRAICVMALGAYVSGVPIILVD
jgi:hypothetical protein